MKRIIWIESILLGIALVAFVALAVHHIDQHHNGHASKENSAMAPIPTGVSITPPPSLNQGKIPAEVAKISEIVVQPKDLPSGWDTGFSEKLDVKLIAQYDSNGDSAWDMAKHPLVYVTTNGPGYGGFMSGTDSPGLVLIDADTYEVILEKQYKLEGVDPKQYWEDHGIGVSPDGQWIYLPTGNMSKSVEEAGLLFIINARTLKIHQILQTSSYPHHVKVVNYYDGTVRKDLVLIENFNWQVPGRIAPGSGIFVLDPNDGNRVVGGFRSEDVQGNPYLSFPHPGGRYLYVGLPPGAISDPDIRHKLEGTVAVIDMKTWKPVKYFKAGFDPIWVSFSTDGKYAYIGDGGSDEIFKIDNVTLKEIGTSRSSVHGGYGLALNWDDTKLYVVEKGEASHNRGKLLGRVDPVGMNPVDSYATHCLRGDHALVHPDPDRNELWISYNSNFREVVFDMKTDTVKKTITHSGSSHNGAFVKYVVHEDGSWHGEVLSDQSGLHGSARVLKEENLGVKEIVWKNEKVNPSVFRQEQPKQIATPAPSSTPQLKEFTVRVTENGFGNDPNFQIKVKRGDTVRITFINEDPYGDVHPISFVGINIAPFVLSRDNKTATVEFVAEQSGSYGFTCQNQWCNIHPRLRGRIVVEE